MCSDFQNAVSALQACLSESAGFALSIWRETELLSHASGQAKLGQAWQPDTLVPVWSTGKGPAAFTVLWALAEAGVSLEAPLGGILPNWKHGGTVGELMSHQLGLAALDKPQLVDDEPGILRQLWEQPLNWPLGAGQGYHPRSIGYLWDALVRQLSGKSLAEYWREKFADPYALELYFGVPEDLLERVATVKPGLMRPRPEEVDFRKGFMDAKSLTARAFGSIRGWNNVGDFNRPEALRVGPVAFGCVASARALAKFYALLMTEAVPAKIREQAETARCQDEDFVLRQFTCFTAGFQKDPVHPLSGEKLRHHYGPGLRAFGHPGAGGSMAYGDPETGLGVSLVLNSLEPGVFPSEEILAVLRASVRLVKS
jgi:CubicO group peptidase (beta-lactamase class C family)